MGVTGKLGGWGSPEPALGFRFDTGWAPLSRPGASICRSQGLTCVLGYFGGHGHVRVGATQLTLSVEKVPEVGKRGRKDPGGEFTRLDSLSRRSKVQEAGMLLPEFKWPDSSVLFVLWFLSISQKILFANSSISLLSS